METSLKHLNKKSVAAASLLCASIASAATVGPEFFGYSKPFFGGQVLLISKASCAVPTKGVEADLLEQHEASSQNARGQTWHKSEGQSKFGSMPGCWTEVVKFKEPAVLNCNLVDGALDKKQCVVLAKSMFLDASQLPPEPPKKRAAQF